MKKHKDQPIAMRFGDTELFKTGASGYDLRDPYTIAISVSWREFFILLIVLEIVVNSVFAALYALNPGCIANARPGSLLDAFFFSIQTLATVGYGTMSPATLYGNIVSAIEIVCGLTFTAIITGLIFVRFSKPRPNILFADHAVVARHNGKPTLMVRIANGRDAVLAGATARLAVLKWYISDEGRTYRQAFDLKLVRDNLALFLLTWTLMHEIDESSPLYGIDAEKLNSGEAVVILTIEARDHASSADVFDVKFYGPGKILPGMNYQDAVSHDENGRTHADLRKLSLVEPDVSREASEAVLAESQGLA
jgi:inward rectifier potassium channel